MTSAIKHLCGIHLFSRPLDATFDGKRVRADEDDVDVEVMVAMRQRTSAITLRSAMKMHPDLNYAESLDEACMDADLVLHLTKRKQFREIDPAKLAVVVARRSIIDGRNALDPSVWRAEGWNYRALGGPRI